ncbi:MAG TPA: pantoate--beta-alanine ligase [Steroidobacteraceae bacterium]|jgi:pantoate--beta-alanine ligase
MQLLTRSASVRDRIRVWRAAGSRVALVPTAGTLHKGHMSLVAEAQERADHVVVSIFANPREREALTLEADRELLQKMGATLAFVPPLQEIYPIGRELAAAVNVPTLADILEGADRPGHFADVATVLTKLFNLIKPDIALFGERDFQQLAIVRRLVDDLFLPIEVVGCATWRDADGLAVATANKNLTAEERTLAPRLYATLCEIAAAIDAGARDYEALQRQGTESLAASGFTPEYFAIRQAADLAAVRNGARDLVILAAVRLNARRLIDNSRVRLIDRY